MVNGNGPFSISLDRFQTLETEEADEAAASTVRGQGSIFRCGPSLYTSVAVSYTHLTLPTIYPV